MSSFFDKMYVATAEVIKATKKPLIKRSLKRKFESAKDSAVNEKLKALETLTKLRNSINENPEDFDLNSVIKQHQIIKDADATIIHLKNEYKFIFGEELSDPDMDEAELTVTLEDEK